MNNNITQFCTSLPSLLLLLLMILLVRILYLLYNNFKVEASNAKKEDFKCCNYQKERNDIKYMKSGIKGTLDLDTFKKKGYKEFSIGFIEFIFDLYKKGSKYGLKSYYFFKSCHKESYVKIFYELIGKKSVFVLLVRIEIEIFKTLRFYLKKGDIRSFNKNLLYGLYIKFLVLDYSLDRFLSTSFGIYDFITLDGNFIFWVILQIYVGYLIYVGSCYLIMGVFGVFLFIKQYLTIKFIILILVLCNYNLYVIVILFAFYSICFILHFLAIGGILLFFIIFGRKVEVLEIYNFYNKEIHFNKPIIFIWSSIKKRGWAYSLLKRSFFKEEIFLEEFKCFTKFRLEEDFIDRAWRKVLVQFSYKDSLLNIFIDFLHLLFCGVGWNEYADKGAYNADEEFMKEERKILRRFLDNQKILWIRAIWRKMFNK